MINKPDHYQRANHLCRNALKTLGYKTFDGDMIEITERSNAWILHNAYLFNAAKYLWRLGAKDSAIEDLSKARWYLERSIDTETTNNAKAQECLNALCYLEAEI